MNLFTYISTCSYTCQCSAYIAVLKHACIHPEFRESRTTAAPALPPPAGESEAPASLPPLQPAGDPALSGGLGIRKDVINGPPLKNS